MEKNAGELFPLKKPFSEDYLRVSAIHTIRYALYGNPEGNPVFFLHGGPGCGSDDEDARWFNPDDYFIVTHDQRGSGKSMPGAEIKENTPQNLIEDIEKLRLKLNINSPILIFGGSWGSTLALLYAEAFPHNVRRMILRGIFTCTWEAQDYFYSENGAALFSLDAWTRLISALPDGVGRLQEKIFRLIENSDLDGKKKWCRVLAEYEYSFFGNSAEELEKILSDFKSYYPEMRINMYNQSNRFFLSDGQILSDAHRISHIPVTLIHGASDVICPPSFVWQLHKLLPNSKLVLIPEAGHLSNDPLIRQALLKALDGWD